MIAAVQAPPFDWAALAPLIALAGGAVLALLAGLFSFGRVLSVVLGSLGAIVAIVAAAGLWADGTVRDVIGSSLVIDRLALSGIVLSSASALAGILLSARNPGTDDAGHGETVSLILASAVGMAILSGANDLVTVFLGLELLSIPLYVLCASHVERTASLESGLKYLILGSVGSATALMGIALIYGATGSMAIPEIARLSGEGELAGLLLPGVALLVAGFAFKIALAPLHQWAPDVYDGAPTGVTAFMSVATKTAALVVLTRLLLVALPATYDDLWRDLLLALAAISIVVGNVGALGQTTMRRLMGYSSVAQGGYLVAALAVGAVGALLAYLAAYAVATLAVFAVVAAREMERPDLSDDVRALDGLARSRPLLAWIGTLGFFGLAGLPLTAGFFGKVALAGVLINGGVAWLAVLLLVGSIISLAYYAPPVFRMWRPAAPAADGDPAPTAVEGATSSAPRGAAAPSDPVAAGGRRAPWEVGAVALIAALLVLAGGIYPQPVFDLAGEATTALLGATGR